jgi:hypothetical protein
MRGLRLCAIRLRVLDSVRRTRGMFCGVLRGLRSGIDLWRVVWADLWLVFRARGLSIVGRRGCMTS